eukprot:gnl/TRDRNA2_/TRDRNA2_81618_c0_seq1.p1 gnl/TRDRNA2_/TRDRNA2_81618_c0~~gnl/TRDRNA2_/TRDRNA2_81618_c0_seq1.p1  ORF type:complete len:420 (+),score=126.49 gnl/TRDRNA2_/TRDRNA2_81618_c0_seq1:98-1357(+)
MAPGGCLPDTIFAAAAAGDVEQCKLITDEFDKAFRPGQEPKILKLDVCQRPVLVNAAMNGHAAVLELLVDKKADVLAADKLGWTGLHWAAFNDDEQVLRTLLALKADPLQEDNKSSTPREVAERVLAERIPVPAPVAEILKVPRRNFAKVLVLLPERPDPAAEGGTQEPSDISEEEREKEEEAAAEAAVEEEEAAIEAEEEAAIEAEEAEAMLPHEPSDGMQISYEYSGDTAADMDEAARIGALTFKEGSFKSDAVGEEELKYNEENKWVWTDGQGKSHELGTEVSNGQEVEIDGKKLTFSWEVGSGEPAARPGFVLALLGNAHPHGKPESREVRDHVLCPFGEYAHFAYTWTKPGRCRICKKQVTGLHWPFYKCTCCGRAYGYCEECAQEEAPEIVCTREPQQRTEEWAGKLINWQMQ